MGLNETLRRAIGDATTLIAQGRYSSSINRVHTALYCYLRIHLDEFEDIKYEESDMMPKLFNLLYRKWEEISNSDINYMMLKALRSASAIIDLLNDIRNYSLAHPNEEIINEAEAKLILGLMENICR